MAKERPDQTADSELAIEQAIHDWFRKGYSENWINNRFKSIEVCKGLTDVTRGDGTARPRTNQVLLVNRNMNTLEDSVLKAFDLVAEQSQDKVTKQLMDLFKSAMLKKYKIAYDDELASGKVHEENLDKTVDFCFTEASFTYRQMNIAGMSDDFKEHEIRMMESILGSVKEMVRSTLKNHGIKVVE